MEYFTTKRITEATTVITDITGVRCFLVEGSKEAVLIDTGTGTGDLKSLVGTLTELPVTVILTHGHCDHAGGAASFEKVLLPVQDRELAVSHAGLETRLDYVRFVVGDAAADNIPAEDYSPVWNGEAGTLLDGMVFDLGGVTLKAIAVPGHTRGMTSILNETERWILLGDACNNFTFLWADESLSVREYRTSLNNLKQYEAEYDTVYISHDPGELNKSVLDDVIRLCDKILAGTDDAEPFTFMDEKGLKIARKIGPDCSGAEGNIIYRRVK